MAIVSEVKKMTVPAKVGMSGVVELLLLVVLVAGVVSWGAYAYRNPHSTSGQMLIRVRRLDKLLPWGLQGNRENFQVLIVFLDCLAVPT